MYVCVCICVPCVCTGVCHADVPSSHLRGLHYLGGASAERLWAQLAGMPRLEYLHLPDRYPHQRRACVLVSIRHPYVTSGPAPIAVLPAFTSLTALSIEIETGIELRELLTTLTRLPRLCTLKLRLKHGADLI